MFWYQAEGKEKKKRQSQLIPVKRKRGAMDAFGTSGTITPSSLSLRIMSTPKCLGWENTLRPT